VSRIIGDFTGADRGGGPGEINALTQALDRNSAAMTKLGDKLLSATGAASTIGTNTPTLFPGMKELSEAMDRLGKSFDDSSNRTPPWINTLYVIRDTLEECRVELVEIYKHMPSQPLQVGNLIRTAFQLGIPIAQRAGTPKLAKRFVPALARRPVPLRALAIQPVRVVNFSEFPGAGGAKKKGPPPPKKGKSFLDFLGGAAIGGLIGGAIAGPAGAKVGATIGEKLAPILVPLDAMKSAVSSVIGPLTLLGSTALSAVGSLAGVLSDPTSGIPALANTVRPVVEALNPYAFTFFDQAVRDATAAIGTTLTPVVTALTPVVRDFADVMYAASERLSGPLKTVTDALGSTLRTMVDVFGQLLVALQPVIEFSADVLKGALEGLAILVRGLWLPLIEVGKAVWEVVAPFAEIISPSITVAKNLKTLAAAFVAGTYTIAIAVGKLAKFLSFGLIDIDVAGRIRKGLEAKPAPKKSSIGLAAASNPQYRSIIDIGKEAAKQAFIASNTPIGAPEKIEEQEFFQNVMRDIGDIDKLLEPENLIRILAEAVYKGLKRIKDEAVENAPGGAVGRGVAAGIFGFLP
jgi:hypothetical protein